MKTSIETKTKHLSKKVNSLSITKSEKEEILFDIRELSETVKHFRSIFLTAASTSVNVVFILHQLDYALDSLGKSIQKGDLAKTEKIYEYLKQTIDAYSGALTHKEEKLDTPIPLASILRQAIFSVEYRFESHNIELITEYTGEFYVRSDKGLVASALMSLFANSIYWMDFHKIKNKKVCLKVYSDKEFITVVVADSGKGFNIPFEDAIAPFITERASVGGTGIGLHLVEQIMSSLGHVLEEGDWKEDGLTEDFSEGAVIRIKFAKIKQ